jgi:hypothetical protein
VAKQITFIKPYPPFNPGESVTWPDDGNPPGSNLQDVAERLVASGHATAVGFAPNAVLGAKMLRALQAGDAEAMYLQTKAGFSFGT